MDRINSSKVGWKILWLQRFNTPDFIVLERPKRRERKSMLSDFSCKSNFIYFISALTLILVEQLLRQESNLLTDSLSYFDLALQRST